MVVVAIFVVVVFVVVFYVMVLSPLLSLLCLLVFVIRKHSELCVFINFFENIFM